MGYTGQDMTGHGFRSMASTLLNEQGWNQDAIERQLADEELWQLLLLASKAGSAVDRAIASGEPAHVAKYAFQLAQAFSNFYHQYPVLTEENPEKRTFLLWVTEYFRNQIEQTLSVLGIAVPAYM